MMETSPLKAPPAAPVDVQVGARAGLSVLIGRNSTAPKIGKPVNTGGQD